MQTPEQPFQLFNKLTDTEHAALRESIEQFGIKVPILKDSYGRIIDGHHRAAIAEELGIDCPTITVDELDDEQLEGLAFDLNTARRHLTAEQRLQLVKELRQSGKTIREIADVTGASRSTTSLDVKKLRETDPDFVEPETVTSADGTERKASKPVQPKPAPVKEPEPEPVAELSADETVWAAVARHATSSEVRVQVFTTQPLAGRQADAWMKLPGWSSIVTELPVRTDLGEQ